MGTSALLKWHVSAERKLLDLQWLADSKLNNELMYWTYWQTTCGPFVSRVFKSG
jgi:hypothetical protein